MKGTCFFIILLLLVFSSGCIKETYNLDVLSKDAQLSPTFVLPAIKGSLTFGDLVKPGNPLTADNEGKVKLVFRKDSIVNLSRNDFFELEGLLSYSRQFRLGNLKIDPFGGSTAATPAELTSPLLQKLFPAFTNFIQASFASGYADIVVKNEMSHPVEGIIVSFSTSSGRLRNPVAIPFLQPGQGHSFSIDLAGLSISNVMTVGVTGANIPGADENLGNVAGTVMVSMNARDPRISSGKAVIPMQEVSDTDSINYIDITAGADVELDRIKFNRGRIIWHAVSPCLLAAKLGLSFPTVTRNGIAVSENIIVNPINQAKGSFQLTAATISLNNDPRQPFNRFPFTCDLSVSSNKSMVKFNSNEQVNLEMKLVDTDPDYIKGYFGQQVHSIASQSINTGIDEYTSKIDGNIQFTEPVVKLSYSNSFSIPIDVALNVVGKRKSEVVNLGLDPFPVSYPVENAGREISATYLIGKENSLLPDLISLLPEELIFSGAAKFNTKGEAKHLRDNYIFGSSRFVASIDVEVPLSMKFDSIHLADTLENFLSGDKLFESLSKANGNTSGNIRIVSLDLRLRNSFPFDVSFTMGFGGNTKGDPAHALTAGKILKAAKTDAGGRVVSPSETLTTVEFSDEFLEKLNGSDKIIFNFYVNTGENKEIRIFTDYEIEFSASVTVNTELNFELP